MPVLIRFYIRNCIIGFALAGAFVAALLYLNVANLWQLVSGSDVGILAVIILWVSNGIVFAGAQTAVAVLLMSEDDADSGPKGGRKMPLGLMSPAPMPALAPAPKRQRDGTTPAGQS